jgi:hypothetical protein
MVMDLPPPDPNEIFASPPGATSLPQPLVVFVREPSHEAQQLAGAILTARPGVLFVF